MMEDKMFAELLGSVKEAVAISRGETQPARVTELPEPDVRAIRKKHRLSQIEFANLLGINVGTLRNWEQRRRSPRGPARVLLAVADKHPELIVSIIADIRAQNQSTMRTD
jgi:putative transcriptional regulator